MKQILNLWKSLPQRLSRVTSSGNFIPELDGLRFIAIFLVLIFHLSERMEKYALAELSEPGELAGRLLASGNSGVYLFFSISGFILALPFAAHFLNGRRKVNLKRYFIRRLTRLEPPYILVMVGLFLVLLLKGDFLFSELLPHLGAGLLYIHHFVFGISGGQDYIFNPINPVTWSLEIEVQFYILAPLLTSLIFVIKKPLLRRVALIGSIFAIVLMHQPLGWEGETFRLTILGTIQHFLIGFLMVDIYLTDWKDKKITKHWGWDFIVFAGMFGIMYLTWPENIIQFFWYELSLFAIVYGAFKGQWFNKFVSNPWITAIGGMCYTIYLIHLPLFEGLLRITNRLQIGDNFWLNLLIQIVVVFPILFVVTSVVFLTIEKPFMQRDWPKKVRMYFLNEKLRTPKASTKSMKN